MNLITVQEEKVYTSSFYIYITDYGIEITLNFDFLFSSYRRVFR